MSLVPVENTVVFFSKKTQECWADGPQGRAESTGTSGGSKVPEGHRGTLPSVCRLEGVTAVGLLGRHIQTKCTQVEVGGGQYLGGRVLHQQEKEAGTAERALDGVRELLGA